MEFLWGASISSHQVEGGLENDWTRWERRHADEWAEQSLLERVTNRLTGASPGSEASKRENYLSGKATDHFHRFEEDIELADEIGLNALRLSVEWSRVQPTSDTFDEEALDHYRRVVDELRTRDIEPVVTVWHYAQPQWFVDEYGWHDARSPTVFARYAERVAEALGGVRCWIPMNEPMGYLRAAYLGGGFPPKGTKRRHIPAVYRHLSAGHSLAAERIREAVPDATIGSALASGAFEPYTDNRLNRWLADFLCGAEREWFLESILGALDWIGINFYYHYEVDVLCRNLRHRDSPRSDMGWPLSPEGLYEVVTRTGRYGKPVVVTEHGLADREDEHREWYIRESVEQLSRARDEGTPVGGYFHWSLTDNFEWTEGFWPRFGLVEVDYEDGRERRVRESADAYADVIDERDWEAEWGIAEQSPHR